MRMFVPSPECVVCQEAECVFMVGYELKASISTGSNGGFEESEIASVHEKHASRCQRIDIKECGF